MNHLRKNLDLDDAFADNGSGPNRPLPKARRQRKASAMDRDKSRRMAFKVLNILSDLGGKDRQRVLTHALKLNKG